MQLAQIKNQVFTAIATTSTAAVKQWAEAHNLDVDLRSRDGWLAVLNAIARHAQPIAENAIATVQATAKAIHEADMVELNDRICTKAAEIKQRVAPFARIGWQCIKLVALGFAIAAIYCLRAGQKLRGFVDEFEDTGMGPHAIAWYFLKPALHRARYQAARQWVRIRERAIAFTAQRKVREAAVYAVSGMIAVSWLG